MCHFPEIKFLLVIGIFINCSPIEQKIDSRQEDINQKKKTTNLKRSLKVATVYFSTNKTKDTFTLAYDNSNLLESDIDFTIKNSEDEIIYRENFKSESLIGYGLIKIKTPTKNQKEDYIRLRIENFFEQSNFISPAISSADEYSSDYNSLSEHRWNQIKGNLSAVGFHYKIWESDLRWITVLNGEVLEYKNCC